MNNDFSIQRTVKEIHSNASTALGRDLIRCTNDTESKIFMHLGQYVSVFASNSDLAAP